MIPTVLLVVAIALLATAAVVLSGGTVRRGRRWEDRTTRRMAWSAFAWTLVVGAYLLVGPTSTIETATTSSDVANVTTTSTTTLLEHEGASVIPVLLVPVALAVVGAAGGGPSSRRRRIAVGSALAGLCLVGALSIGLFYVPAALALIVAGLMTRGRDGPVETL